MSLRVWTWVCALALAPLVLAGAQPAKLAVIAPDPVNKAAADLLTVELSKVGGVALLERTEIDRVIKEQSLSASQERDFMQLGKLLRADGLIILTLDTVSGLPMLGTRIVAVNPGVIVGAMYEKYSAEAQPGWAMALAAKVAGLVPKLQVSAGEAIPVSVLNLRSALPSREAARLERELTWLLIHRLANEPRFFVLERVQLERLAFEKGFADVAASDFWTSRFVVDGEIAEQSAGALSITLRLERSGNAPKTVQVSGDKSDLRNLVESLATAVTRELGQTGSASSWKPVAEGRRFYEEAVSAERAGLPEQALPAAEASQILGFESQPQQLLLTRLYIQKAFRREPQTPILSVLATNVDLASALRGFEIYDLVLAHYQPPTNSTRSGVENLGASLLDQASSVVRWYWDRQEYAGHREDVDFLREQIRRTAGLLRQKGREKDLNLFYALLARAAPYWYDDPAQVLQAYQETLSAPCDDYGYSIFDVRRSLVRKDPGSANAGSRTPWLIDWRGSGEENLKTMWQDFVKRRVQSPALKERLDGRLLEFSDAVAEDVRSHLAASAEADLWTNRAEVITNKMAFAAATLILDYLRSDEDFRFRFWDYFLHEGGILDYFFFEACYGPGFTNRANASALWASIQSYDKWLWPNGRDVHGLHSDLDAFRDRLARAFPDLREQGSGSLNVTRCWPPLEAHPTPAQRTYFPREVLYAADAVWVSADRLIGNQFQTTFTSLQLPGNATTVLTAPRGLPRQNSGPLEGFDHAFAVTDQWIFWVCDGRLARCAITNGQWDEIEVPATRFPLLRVVNGFLYYAFPTQSQVWALKPEPGGILKINPRTLQTELLASSRRKPARTQLDDVEPYQVYDVFAGPGHSLYASVLSDSARTKRRSGQLYRYSESDGNWTVVHPEAGYNFVPYRAVPFEGGNLIQPIEWPVERAFFLYDNGSLEFLFPDPFHYSRQGPVRWPEHPLLWQYAPWHPVTATRNGDDVWVLGSRRDAGETPLTLYLFRKSESEPVVPLHFPLANTDRYWTTSGGPVGILNTPEGMVIFGTGDTAFWFLPKEELNAAIADNHDQETNSVSFKP